MNERELKDAIALKTMQLEATMAAQTTYDELTAIYKDLKELKCQLVWLEHLISNEKGVYYYKTRRHEPCE